MRHWVLTLALALAVTCALLLLLTASGLLAPKAPREASPVAATTQAQWRDLLQRLDALEARAQAPAAPRAPQEAPGVVMPEQWRVLEQRLAALEPQAQVLAQGLTDASAVDAGIGRQLDTLNQRLETGLARIDPLVLGVAAMTPQSARNAAAIERQETRIEEGSVKLFETLIAIDGITKALAHTQAGVARLHTELAAAADRVAAPGALAAGPPLALLLGMLMPLGVIVFTAGRASAPATPPLDDLGGHCLRAWFGAGLGYAVIGFGLMCGSSSGGWVGVPWQFWPDLLQAGPGQAAGPLTRLALQLPVAGAVGLIVCSAGWDRLSPLGQWLTATLVGALLFPLFGHWAGAQPLQAQDQGWLVGLGFADVGAAGSAALAGVTALVLAAKLGRGAAVGAPYPVGSGVGALILWAAWLGILLVGTSTTGNLPALVLATAAGAVGAAAATLMAGTLFASSGWERRLPAGALAGAVAAGAVAATASVLGLVLLGLATGVVYGIVLKVAGRRLGAAAELAGSFAAAGVCGILAPTILGPGLLWVQLTGLAAVLGLAVTAGLLLAQPPRRLARLRPSADRAS